MDKTAETQVYRTIANKDIICYNEKRLNRIYAGVAELADAHDSKSCGAIRAGSSPATGSTKRELII